MSDHFNIKPREDEVDLIAKPPHYTQHPAGIECLDVTEHMTFNIGNAIKYLWRAGLKSSETHDEDLQKAITFIERERKRVHGVKSKS